MCNWNENDWRYDFSFAFNMGCGWFQYSPAFGMKNGGTYNDNPDAREY